jgi:hemoglobin-like flavoprotein
MSFGLKAVRLSKVEVVLVRKYFELIFYRRQGPQLTQLFYDSLFRSRPNLREIFPTEMEHQNRKLARSIKMIVEVLPDLDRLDDHFLTLAKAHRGLGLKEDDFRLFATCLIRALEALTKEEMIQEGRNALTRVCLEVGRRISARPPKPRSRQAA